MSLIELERKRYYNSKREAEACMIVWKLIFTPNYTVKLDEDMTKRVERIINKLPDFMKLGNMHLK